MTRVAPVGLLLVALFALAQGAEIGVTAGGGVMSADDVLTSSAIAFGAEACGLCSGSFGVFGEYSHLERVGGARATEITRFDLVAGGVRLQGGRRIRPFFDAGVVYGVDSFRWSRGSDSHGNPGVVLAGGAGIRFRDRYYVRPQFRLYALRGIHAVAAATVAFGVRF